MSISMQTSEKANLNLKDLYEIKGMILSTRTADLFSAVEKTSSSEIRLWKIKDQLPDNQGLIAEFKNRLRALFKLRSEIGRFEVFGVDNQRVAYAILPNEKGGPIAGPVESSEYAFDVLGQCIERIALIHAQGILCGDICANSFWVDESRSVSFVGIMGSLDFNVPKFDPQKEPISNYLAPEQLNSGLLSLSTDVFAIGVLAYFMLTGSFPEREGTNIKDIPVNSSVPEWLREMILKSVNSDSQERYANAGELLMEYKAKLKANFVSGAKKLVEKKSDFEKGKEAPEAVRRVLKGVLLIGLIATGIIISMPIYTQYVHNRAIEQAVAPHRAVASESLNSLITGLLAAVHEPIKRGEVLAQIIDSEDPVAHAMLVAVSRNTTDVQFRKSCEDAIIERARRAGLMRTAEIVANWFSRFNEEQGLPSYSEDVLLALDGSLPGDSRSKSIRRIYAENPTIALYLAGAAAVDSQTPEDYRGVLGQLIGDKLNLESLDGKGAFSLVLASVSLSQRYGRDIVDRIDSMPDQDVLWSLSVLAERDDALSAYFAKEVIERNLIQPPKSYLVKLIAERQDLPSDVLKSLSKGVCGTLEPTDIGSFGRWYDSSIEKILLTLAATEMKTEVALEIFDTLASKELVHRLSSKLMRWVKDNFWEDRLKFGKSIGLLALNDEFSESDLQESLAGFDAYVTDRTLLAALLSAENSRIVEAVVNRFKDVVPISNLLLLLTDTNKNIRIAAIKAAARTNDVGALRYVLKNYESERDPDVRRAYEESFWVVKQRIAK
jgi:hypothetical protein